MVYYVECVVVYYVECVVVYYVECVVVYYVECVVVYYVECGGVLCGVCSGVLCGVCGVWVDDMVCDFCECSVLHDPQNAWQKTLNQLSLPMEACC